jgi:hypothetical protein
MTRLRRIQIGKWAGATVAVLFLSQCFRRWREFTQAPTPLAYLGILLALTLFLLLMGFLAVVVYGEEQAKGHLTRPRPFFERWLVRLFPNSDAPSSR